jgi:D-Tyr-tRNAtyr deacylase
MQSDNSIEPLKANLDLICESRGTSMAYEDFKDFINNVNFAEMSEEKKLELLAMLESKLGRFNRPVQILGGNQLIGQNQFIMSHEVFKGVIASFVSAVKENFGEEIGAEIVKEAIRAAIAKL